MLNADRQRLSWAAIADPGSEAGAAPLASAYLSNAKFGRDSIGYDPDAAAAETALGLWIGHPDGPGGIALPAPVSPQAPFGEVVRRRRSIRRFENGPLDPAVLSTLLDTAAGAISDPDGRVRRTYPSGGGRYPVEVLMTCVNVTGIAPGIYRYAAVGHRILPVRMDLDVVDRVVEACLYDAVAEHAALIVTFVAVLPRSTSKYGERGYRLAAQEVGHIAQNLQLAATALGVGAVSVSGFEETSLERAIGIDGLNEVVLGNVVLGWPRGE